MLVQVAIPRSTPEALTYRAGDDLAPFIQPGVRVRVPLRQRQVTGLVVDCPETTDLDVEALKEIVEVLDPEPLLPAHLLELADFMASYYRCPLGDTLASMLPAALLRTDAETAEVTTTGAATPAESLTELQGRLLTELQAARKLRVATLLSRVGTSRSPLDALVHAGLVRIKRRRRDRGPKVEVAAVRLKDRPGDELLAACARAPQQRAVIEWLAEQDRPALVSELCAAVGCSPGVVRTLDVKGLVERFSQRPAPPARWSLAQDQKRPQLTDEQQVAVDAVVKAVQGADYAPFLLEGVTGSGKTEVYLRCLEAVLAAGGSGIVLVPEIGLTPAASGAVEHRFGSRVAVLHSALSEGERWQEWRRAHEGEVRIVVGPRSALFAPVRNPGLIVVDEEQDSAYKQQEAPRYHARDLALVMGQRLGVPVLLCSATPSGEAYALAQRGLAETLRLTRRVAGGSLPEVELVDLRKEPPDPGEQGRTLLSQRLREAMGETLARDEQVILLIQRRGWAPVLLCRDCGHRLECPECSIALVVHQRSRDLRCHYCGHHASMPQQCPRCDGSLLDPIGAGTEKVAHHLKRLFPDVATAILDRDTVRRRGGLEDTLGAFSAGRARVLVGTQMVAKGHHFPNVTLTGVISADALLNLPDFRAGERTFQLLTQVAGRAGRGDRAGRVIIQTYYPDHPAVLHARNHDVHAFLADELVFRTAFRYPPAERLALIRFESRSASGARQAAEAAVRTTDPVPDSVRVRGPSPAPLERLRGQWRWQILISAKRRVELREVLERAESAEVPTRVRRVIDIDPLSTL